MTITAIMHCQVAILAGDFLLARASVTLASLRNTEVIQLLSQVLEHLVAGLTWHIDARVVASCAGDHMLVNRPHVLFWFLFLNVQAWQPRHTGEILQLTTSAKELTSMDYYLRKTFYKTASLMANSCKAIAVLAQQPAEVAHAAWTYGNELGLAFQVGVQWLAVTMSPCAFGDTHSSPTHDTTVGGRRAGFHGHHQSAGQASAQRPAQRHCHRPRAACGRRVSTAGTIDTPQIQARGGRARGAGAGGSQQWGVARQGDGGTACTECDGGGGVHAVV